MPLDTAVSRDRNLIKRQAEKILQYEDLATEIQDLWNVKTKVMIVTTEAAGIIHKIIQHIPDQHTGKTRNWGPAKNSHTLHTYFEKH